MTRVASRVLEVREVCKSFTLHTRGGVALPVLERQSLTLDAGECLVLSGPSGRGKSTLVKCLYGTCSIDRGSIVLTRRDGRIVDLARADARTWLDLRLRDIACVSQFLRSLPRRSAIDVVAARVVEAEGAADSEPAAPVDEAVWRARWAAARDRAAPLLERLRLPRALWQLPPATFSGGEQQRVNIARAFVLPSRLLLLDEPTSALDAGNRAVVVGLIHEAKAAGTAVVGIFHDDAVREAVADRRIEMTGVPA